MGEKEENANHFGHPEDEFDGFVVSVALCQEDCRVGRQLSSECRKRSYLALPVIDVTASG